MSEYLGYKTVVSLSEDELADFYQQRDENTVGCLTNEYLLIEDGKTGSIIDQLKWSGDAFVEVPFKAIRSRNLGTIKPRNIHQRLLIDMLYDRNTTVKVTCGPYGSGKDMLMIGAALDLIEKGVFDKIVWVRNNIEVADSKPIGHLPGSSFDKLLPYAMVIADHVGGQDALERMIESGTIELVHLGFIRGRDIKNAIVMCSEAENMTREHVQLLLGRIGEGSSLWLNGDFRQTDAQKFIRNNGLMTAIEKLKGHRRFGYVKLSKTERSETAAMADLLDE